jgi:streptogramin lyase
VVSDLAAGSDGNLWFTANAATTRSIPASFVGRVDPATGAVTEFPIPSGATLPGALTTGSDGNLWFPEANVHPGVARVTTH